MIIGDLKRSPSSLIDSSLEEDPSRQFPGTFLPMVDINVVQSKPSAVISHSGVTQCWLLQEISAEIIKLNGGGSSR
ncbi:hypothetical protein NQZ68_016120 [Dissostichus eleginoides]|nr:hypothetical protein NQZ68_016120 [Dissostichus eleginoides]